MAKDKSRGIDLCWKERAEGLKSFRNHVKQCTEKWLIITWHDVHHGKKMEADNTFDMQVLDP